MLMSRALLVAMLAARFCTSRAFHAGSPWRRAGLVARARGAARLSSVASDADARASAPAAAAPERVVVRKPDVDPREYRMIWLPNGLQALLASDPRADRAGAALAVKARAARRPTPSDAENARVS